MKMHLDPSAYQALIRENENLKHELEIARRYDGAYWMAEAVRMRSELMSIQVECVNGGFGMKKRIQGHVTRALEQPSPKKKAS